MDMDVTLPRIKCLPVLLANQIAAGEVIEHPASVVKELVENAIDAGADDIEVSLIQGGLERITIRDNGCGIVQEDLPLALTRHATSKLEKPSDLFGICSMGFRGEALASIAAVSKLTITSRPRTQQQAWSLRYLDPTAPPDCLPASHPFGTSVQVAELFYNTPVRRKFLRSVRTELLAIETAIKRLALAHPAIGFKLKHNETLLLHLAGTKTQAQIEQRLGKLLSTPFLRQAIYVDVTHQGLRLEGWLSSHTFHRSQHDWIYWSVNQRPVRDKLLLHAFKQVYAYSLPPDRHPAGVFNLTLDPHTVDVNVHPTKHEVRFRNSRLVHDFIVEILTKALAPDETTVTQTEDLCLAPILEHIQPQQPIDAVSRLVQVHEPHQQTSIPRAYVQPLHAIPAGIPRPTPKQIEQQLTTWQQPQTPQVLLHPPYLWVFSTTLHIIQVPKAVAWLAEQAVMRQPSLDGAKPKSRLFPLRINLPHEPPIALSAWQRLLGMLGIHMTLVTEQVCLINHIPTYFDALDMAKALPHLFDCSALPDTSETVQLLCEFMDYMRLQTASAGRDLWEKLHRANAPRQVMWHGESETLYQQLFE